MTFPDAVDTLNTSHVDGIGEIIHASDINAAAASILRTQSSALTGAGFRNFKSIFGTSLERKNIPRAAWLTQQAIAGAFNWPLGIKALKPATTSLATQLSGVTAGTQVRLQPGVYREALPSITVANVRIWARGDVAITAMDDWSVGTANTWSAAPSPNATTSFQSSLTVPTFTVDGDTSGTSVVTNATKAAPEQVMVDGVLYNRVATGSTLTAGQFMLDASRHVIMCPPTASMSGRKVEVTTRTTWCQPGVGGTGLTLDGIYFYGGASGTDTAAPLQQNSQADFTIRNCMLGFVHGICIAGGGASGMRVTDSVFHNCGSIGIVSGSQGTTVQGNVCFNCGGSQNTYSGALDESGYDWTWGSGFCKLVCSDGVLRDNVCWNNGFATLWTDVLALYCTIANNVSWDNRDENCQVEVSQEFRIYGNHIFQTAANQFASRATNGIYISSSRDGVLGPDLSIGQEPNIVMRLGTAYKLGWQTSRNDLPPSGTSNALSGGFKRVVFQHNVAILRKTNGQGPGGPDCALWWSDITNGAPGTAISDASNVGQHLVVGFENASENGANAMTWPTDYIILSDVTGLTGQDATHFFMSPTALNANRWGNANDETGRNTPCRYLTYQEQSEMLNWYGLPLRS